MGRAALMKFLEEEYGDGRHGVDMLWNPMNHRLLDEDDFEKLAVDYGVHAWHFQQNAVCSQRQCEIFSSAPVQTHSGIEV